MFPVYGQTVEWEGFGTARVLMVISNIRRLYLRRATKEKRLNDFKIHVISYNSNDSEKKCDFKRLCVSSCLIFM